MNKPQSCPARRAALRILECVIAKNCPLEPILKQETAELNDPRNSALASELAYGTLRFSPELETIARLLLRRPLRSRDILVHITLLLGLYQLVHTRIPIHAAISESVALLSGEQMRWARALINGCLRTFERNRDNLISEARGDICAQFAHPRWMIELLKIDWPAQWQSILAFNNQPAPMTLRINRRHSSQKHYLQLLNKTGIKATPSCHSPVGITLKRPQKAEQLPGFKTGWVSVQDEASQLATPLMRLEPEFRVLDACAAPGGKTAHMLEAEPQLNITALDKSETRVTTMSVGLERLGLDALCVVANANQPDDWWDGQPFDRILLDAPCSASGLIRRHPDIKYHRLPHNLQRVRELQRSLLNTLWELLADRGMLLYATCSVFQAENAQQISRFLVDQPSAELLPTDVTWGIDTLAGRQILPGTSGMDGFFYALLRKN